MTDKPTEKPTEKPADKPTEKTAEKKNGAPADPKRPHATLDLKAVEIKSAQQPGSPKPAADSKPAAAAASAATATAGTASAGASSAADSSNNAGARQMAEPERPVPPATPPGGRSPLSRFVTHLLAGIAGGAIVLLGGDRLVQMAGTPTPGQRLDAVTAALDKRLAAVESASKPDMAGILAATEDRLSRIDTFSTDLSNLRADQEKLAGEAKALSEVVAANADQSKLLSRVASLEDQLKTIASAASADGGGIAELAAISVRIAEIKNELSADFAALRETMPKEFEKRLAALDETGKLDVARLSQRIETLKADGDRFARAVQAAQEETGRVASALGEVQATLEQQARSFAKSTDVAAALNPMTSLVARIEADLDSVLKTEAERKSNTERIVVALELANLKRAIDRGQGFAAELEAVKAASGGRLELKPLEPYKTSGVPSLAELRDTSRPALNATLDAGAVAPDASVWDRLMAGAGSIVRVRKVDAEGDGKTTDAIVARLQKALAEGRLGDVLAEADRLPPAAAEKLAEWRGKIAARHSVEQAIAATETELKATLAPPAAAPSGAVK